MLKNTVPPAEFTTKKISCRKGKDIYIVTKNSSIYRKDSIASNPTGGTVHCCSPFQISGRSS
jgi:hypothetical protein